MPSPASGIIYQVQLSNTSLNAKLFDSKVNDYVTLGYFKKDENMVRKEEVKGRVVYRTANFIHISLTQFYVMVDVATMMAYFVDLAGRANEFSSTGNQELISQELVTSLG